MPQYEECDLKFMNCSTENYENVFLEKVLCIMHYSPGKRNCIHLQYIWPKSASGQMYYKWIQIRFPVFFTQECTQGTSFLKRKQIQTNEYGHNGILRIKKKLY